MNQINYDYTHIGTGAELAREYRFNYKGPGLYITKTDTMILVRTPQAKGKPVMPVEPGTEFRKSACLPDQLFQMYVWNCPFHETIFSQIAIIPVRVDERE